MQAEYSHTACIRMKEGAGVAQEDVRKFCELVGQKDLAGVERLFGEAVVYHNVGTEPAVGSRGIPGSVEVPVRYVDPIVFRLRNLAVDNNIVLTERVDEVTANGVAAPVPSWARSRSEIDASWHGATTSISSSPVRS